MGLFICNTCRYAFCADAQPDFCPVCRLTSVLADTDTGKKIALPAVRPASGDEKQAYEDMEKAVYAEKKVLEWVDSLSEYELSDDEYHVALMPLHSFKTTPDIYTKQFISDLLPAKESGFEKKGAQVMARNLYIDTQKSFISKIGKERREVGTNDIREVAEQMPPDSAASVLLKFRQDEIAKILHDPQTLGNIRRVDLEKVALEPGAEYLRFLMEWYNSMV